MLTTWFLSQCGESGGGDLGSHFNRHESPAALGTQLPWLNWPLPWTRPWGLADCALNLTVRQRKNVLPSVYWSVKPHHLQLNCSSRRGRRATAPLRTACQNRRPFAAYRVLCHCTWLCRPGAACIGERGKLRHVNYSRRHDANSSEVLLTWGIFYIV